MMPYWVKEDFRARMKKIDPHFLPKKYIVQMNYFSVSLCYIVARELLAEGPVREIKK